MPPRLRSRLTNDYVLYDAELFNIFISIQLRRPAQTGDFSTFSISLSLACSLILPAFHMILSHLKASLFFRRSFHLTLNSFTGWWPWLSHIHSVDFFSSVYYPSNWSVFLRVYRQQQSLFIFILASSFALFSERKEKTIKNWIEKKTKGICRLLN